jgi:hypothetical protein
MDMHLQRASRGINGEINERKKERRRKKRKDKKKGSCLLLFTMIHHLATSPSLAGEMARSSEPRTCCSVNRHEECPKF